jgi:hypothetical protein
MSTSKEEEVPPKETTEVLSKRKGRSTLSVEEYDLIKPFRQCYEQEYDRPTRLHMLRYDILPPVMTHWREKKKKKDASSEKNAQSEKKAKADKKFLDRVQVSGLFPWSDISKSHLNLAYQ